MTRAPQRAATRLKPPRPQPPPRAATPARPPPPPRPAPTPRIIYEDARHLVIDKPSGVALQGQHGSPARQHWDQLVEALKARPESPELYTVHRLDKSTTGALLVAKSRTAAKTLSAQLAKHDVARSYLAVVHGQLREGFEGTVDRPLRLDHDKVRLCPEGEGVHASTRWQCIAASRLFSLVRLEPETGRKHQLRIHCADVLKAPIVGDFKLAPKAPHAEALVELGLTLDHVLLHSHELSFYAWDKDTGKRSRISVTCPPPSSFERFCRAHKLALPSSSSTSPSSSSR
ncbi:hypothetical protein JCM3775_006924 [Rhodotorula graminis]